MAALKMELLRPTLLFGEVLNATNNIELCVLAK